MSKEEQFDINETLVILWSTLERLKQRWESDEDLALKILEFQKEIIDYQVTLISEN